MLLLPSHLEFLKRGNQKNWGRLGTVALHLTVNVPVVGSTLTRGNKIKSFPRAGNEKTCGVEYRQNLAENEKQTVLTLGVICLS